MVQAARDALIFTEWWTKNQSAAQATLSWARQPWWGLCHWSNYIKHRRCFLLFAIARKQEVSRCQSHLDRSFNGLSGVQLVEEESVPIRQPAKTRRSKKQSAHGQQRPNKFLLWPLPCLVARPQVCDKWRIRGCEVISWTPALRQHIRDA